MNLSKLWEILKDRRAWHAAVLGITKSQTCLRDSRTTSKEESTQETQVQEPREEEQTLLLNPLLQPTQATVRPLTCVTCGSYSTLNGTVTSQCSRTMFWKQELATGVGSYQFSVFTELCIFYRALVTHCFMYPLRGRIYTDELHYLKYRIQWVLIVVSANETTTMI